MLYTLYGFFGDLKFIFDRKFVYKMCSAFKITGLEKHFEFKNLPQR